MLYKQKQGQEVHACISNTEIGAVNLKSKVQLDKKGQMIAEENPEPSLTIVYNQLVRDSVVQKCLFLHLISDYARQQLLEELRDVSDRHIYEDF